MAHAKEAQLPPSSNLEPQQLLEYVPAHRIVICTVCKYAIQPLAIARHLKDYHQIRRGARRPFMLYVASLDLLDPEDVVIPTPEDAIPFLSIVAGWACGISTCKYVSVSAKLMTTHWNSCHRATDQTDRWRCVKLQTFFRGKHLKYFEVLQPDRGRERNNIRNCAGGIQGTEIEDDPSGTLHIPNCPPDRGSTTIIASHGYAVNLDTLDFTLLHHFTTLTSFSLSHDPDTQKIWETAVPEMAQTNLYLMHGILACSALHLRYTQPSCQELTTRAVSHQALALPLFRSAISSVNDHTCHSIYAFSRLLVIFAFASQPNISSFLLAQRGTENDLSNCLHLIRGGCAMLYSVKPVIEAGPLRRLVPPRGEHPDISAYFEDPRLVSLGFLPSLEPDEMAWRGMASAIYLDAFGELRAAFRSTYTKGTLYTVWDVVQTWPARVSDDFVTLLHDEHPATLILVAHYCILLKQLETYWYMERYAERLLSQVYTRIGPKWRIWMSWPLQDVGLG